jgi:uncharacterized integral membrane protein
LWVALILSAMVLIFLLIFILQNRAPVQINFRPRPTSASRWVSW